MQSSSSLGPRNGLIGCGGAAILHEINALQQDVLDTLRVPPPGDSAADEKEPLAVRTGNFCGDDDGAKTEPESKRESFAPEQKLRTADHQLLTGVPPPPPAPSAIPDVGDNDFSGLPDVIGHDDDEIAEEEIGFEGGCDIRDARTIGVGHWMNATISSQSQIKHIKDLIDVKLGVELEHIRTSEHPSGEPQGCAARTLPASGIQATSAAAGGCAVADALCRALLPPAQRRTLPGLGTRPGTGSLKLSL